jgi:hypothetical protein
MPPWLLLALAFSLVIAVLYQLKSRHYGWRVMLYWVLVLAGFLGGEALAESLGWNVTRLGDLRLLPDLIASLVIVAVLWFLGL